MKFKLGDQVTVTGRECRAIMGLTGVIVDAFEQEPAAVNMYTVQIKREGHNYVPRYTVFENEIVAAEE